MSTQTLTDELAMFAGDVAFLEEMADLGGLEPLDADEAPWFVIIVGGSLALAFAYAAYCTARGGSYTLRWTWRGFEVACYR